MKKLIISSLGLCVLAGCSTVAGIGADLQVLGRGMSELADNTKAHMTTSSQTTDNCDPYGDELAGANKPPCRQMAQGPRSR